MPTARRTRCKRWLTADRYNQAKHWKLTPYPMAALRSLRLAKVVETSGSDDSRGFKKSWRTGAPRLRSGEHDGSRVHTEECVTIVDGDKIVSSLAVEFE